MRVPFHNFRIPPIFIISGTKYAAGKVGPYKIRTVAFTKFGNLFDTGVNDSFGLFE